MKRQIGYLEAFRTTQRIRRMNREDLERLQRSRLEKVFLHAKYYSGFYQKKYTHLAECPSLQEIPPVAKQELMANFDEWVTDRDVKLDDLKKYISSQDNIGRPYRRKYLVSTTSGSTGHPAIILLDHNGQGVIDALAVTRSIAYKGTMWKLIKAGGKSAAIYATTGHYFGVASVRNKQIKNPLKSKQFSVLSAQMPIEEIVRKLNEFKPSLLGGYPTAIELLIPEKVSGRLKISPVLINTGGEHLSNDLAKRLADVFQCKVQSGYSCTEGGLIAFQCHFGRLHVNEDWVILEPVDQNGNAVAKGTLSDKAYITNLANFVQPIIRYEVTDRIREYRDRCPCGSPLMSIEVEGRTDDMLVFADGEIKILPLSVYVVLKEIPGVARFQVIQTGKETLELRLETTGDRDSDRKSDRESVCNHAIERLKSFLSEHHAVPEIVLSKNLPTAEISGKFKHVSRIIK